jgi:hypothetical protein
MARPILLCLNFAELRVRRYVPNSFASGFANVEEWSVKDRETFFESLTPVTVEQLRKEG